MTIDHGKLEIFRGPLVQAKTSFVSWYIYKINPTKYD